MTIAQIQAFINSRVSGIPNTVAEEVVLWDSFLSQFFIGEVKWLKVDSTYVSANFDGTGLGTSIAMQGWAICNGNNGTTNDNGLVSIAYGADYLTLGGNGGSKDAVLVQHNHKNAYSIQLGGNISGGGLYDVGTNISTSTEGESGIGKNMQPYVIELKIQRIS